MTNLVQSMLELRKALQYFLEQLDADNDAEKILEIPSMFPKYTVGKAYAIKEVFAYGENSVGDPQLYQVLQAHTSTAEWTPDTTPSLYKKIGVTESGYPEWVQPLGASDAYNTGDVVCYNGALYKSTIDGNVWAPDAYPEGWEAIEDDGNEVDPDTPETEPEEGEVVEPDGPTENGEDTTDDGNVEEPDASPEEGEVVDPDATPDDVPENEYPEWVQPEGAGDAYNAGDVVSYNGVLYESTIDGNVWAPDAYPAGWKAYGA